MIHSSRPSWAGSEWEEEGQGRLTEEVTFELGVGAGLLKISHQ